jgi:hypothetical protein
VVIQNLPADCLANGMALGHTGDDGAVAEWLKAAVC